MIQQAVEILQTARSLFVLTGAGISAESGIPTFRGKDGLWKNYSATDLATPEAFRRDPELVWEWYHWRQEIISKTKPNSAHYALVDLEKRCERFLLLTQNVDNLHKRAGSKNLLELHGNIFRTRCLSCNKIFNQSPFLPPFTKGDRGGLNKMNRILQTKLPKCDCGGLLRPDVVWFGESIPQNIWQNSLEFLSNADVALICGTSGVVWPAAAIPEMAKRSGAKTIEVNLDPTPVSTTVDVSIQGKAGEVLPRLIQNLNRK